MMFHLLVRKIVCFSENTCIETDVLLVNYEGEDFIEEEKIIRVNRVLDIAKLVSVIGLGDLCVEEEELLKEKIETVIAQSASEDSIGAARRDYDQYTTWPEGFTNEVSKRLVQLNYSLSDLAGELSESLKLRGFNLDRVRKLRLMDTLTEYGCGSCWKGRETDVLLVNYEDDEFIEEEKFIQVSYRSW